jgi:hypothetical protein
LNEILAKMHKQQISGSRTALWRFLDRHDLAYKKSLCAAERHRADVKRARWDRIRHDTTRLVFIDERAITTNMVRVRGRCPRGERLVSHVPQGEWKIITFIAGLRHNRMTAPMVIEGAMNGPSFLAYI